ncbi:MAG TPA: hypothetical protein PK263_04030, partial [bacterium]|nr:hypothetical protein [bacterium]
TFIIALVGAKAVGKSHYVAVLIHELKQRIGQLFNTSLLAVDEWTMKQYNEGLARYVYDKKEVIPATVSARTNEAVKRPLVYRLKMPLIKMRIFTAEIEILLVFFDTAGEDLTALDIMKTENRYIANADGLIFLLDPLQIPAVCDLLPESITPPIERNNPEDIISRVSNLIGDIRKLKSSQKIDIPVAVAFSKMDALHSIVDPLLMRASNHNGYFDISDSEMINDILVGHLEKWLGRNMINLLVNYFKTFSLFGLSALGSSPDRAGKISGGVTPFRIEDPLLWILYKKGVIEGRKV